MNWVCYRVSDDNRSGAGGPPPHPQVQSLPVRWEAIRQSHNSITKPGQPMFCIVIRPSNIKMSDRISCSDFISINSLFYVFHH